MTLKRLLDSQDEAIGLVAASHVIALNQNNYSNRGPWRFTIANTEVRKRAVAETWSVGARN